MTHPSDSRAYFFKIDTTIKKIRNALQKRFVEAGFDLTVDQWVVVDHLHRNPGIAQATLAEMTAKDAPTVTRIIDLLVKKELVERRMAGDDRRKFLVSLTQTGEQVYEQMLPAVVEIRRKGWGSLSEDDYRHFVRIMDEIYQNFNDDEGKTATADV
ncbi:MarR family transcriptional regulator [Rudanella paleaurantiibacter]|uniref:MarR family transcriptional regulator n=1 Tax=Rudanella paleaurantiibacter TaxID=2614655 RepID=A0A7J5U0R7_9BACT|nr:MarR family transcriptional regulator [Rudanella paleaurantiibacter]KAB7731353.1 MarR family transcriptional regulator [Rudanella paleaurantiibacter]